MITAAEAKELMNGSMKRKRLLYKTRIAWFCGKINREIEIAAEEGDRVATYRMDENYSAKYLPLIAKFYEEQGYQVAYNTEKDVWNNVKTEILICWDFENLHDFWQDKYFKYQYYTEIHEKKLKGIERELFKKAVDQGRKSLYEREINNEDKCVIDKTYLSLLIMCADEIYNYLAIGGKIDAE